MNIYTSNASTKPVPHHTLVTTLQVEIVRRTPAEIITDKINSRNESDLEDKHDAFYVGDMSDVMRKHKLWTQQLPRVQPFYAVKCNEADPILAILAHLGAGFDCASKTELEKVLNLHVPNTRIIYANPCKQSSHIKYAAKNNVKMMTFDNETELHKVRALHPGAKMVVRILPPTNTHCQIQLGMKFGCHPMKVHHLLQVAKSLGVDVIGVSFHVGCGCYDAMAYSVAIASARMVFDIASDIGFHFKLLDIGGGFPGAKNAELPFEEICSVIRLALDMYFPENMNVRIIAEPGRFYVASAFTLAVNVIARRIVTNDENNLNDYDHTLLVKVSGMLSNTASKMDVQEARQEQRIASHDVQATTFAVQEQKITYMYYLNDGVYGSFGDVIYVNAVCRPMLLNEKQYEDLPRFESSLWGPTCDGMDCVLKDCSLPELNIGDWLLFEDMGAYCASIATNFNGMLVPKCYYILQEADWVSVFPQDIIRCESHLPAITNISSPSAGYQTHASLKSLTESTTKVLSILNKCIFLPAICIIAVSLLVW